MLKPQFTCLQDSIEYYMFDTGSPGGIVCPVASGALPAGVQQAQGAGLDSAGRRVTYVSSASGYLPIGVLMTNVVSVDQSRYRTNWFKTECNVGDKVWILTKGRVNTDQVVASTIAGYSLPVTARVGLRGQIYNGDIAGYAASGFPAIGRILTRPDADGFCQVQVDL